MTEMLAWSAVEFAIAGYMVNQIQKEKTTPPTNTEYQNVTTETTTIPPVEQTCANCGQPLPQ